MRVQDLDKSLTMITDPQEVAQVNQQAGAECNRCRALYVEAKNGRYVRVYGTEKVKPLGIDAVHVHREPLGVML